MVSEWTCFARMLNVQVTFNKNGVIIDQKKIPLHGILLTMINWLAISVNILKNYRLFLHKCRYSLCMLTFISPCVQGNVNYKCMDMLMNIVLVKAE
jgi:hypothetical protein